MLKIAFLNLGLFLSFYSLAQKNPTKLFHTVNISSDTSLRITEVTIEEWICFIINNKFDSSLFPSENHLAKWPKRLFDDLKNGNDAKFIKIVKNQGLQKLDKGLYGIIISKSLNKMVKDDSSYFSKHNPITGISFSQAILFCKWKEDLINADQKIKIKISLPSIQLYERVLENKDSMNLEKCYLQNSIKCNCPDLGKNKRFMPHDELVRADAFWPNDLGLYCLQGNAAEMTTTQGIAMGGSFRHYALESFKDKRQIYTQPEEWLGFRYIVTLQQ